MKNQDLHNYCCLTYKLFTIDKVLHIKIFGFIIKICRFERFKNNMEVYTNENTNATEDLSWALQIGDLDTVKEQLQRLSRENGVIHLDSILCIVLIDKLYNII